MSQPPSALSKKRKIEQHHNHGGQILTVTVVTSVWEKGWESYFHVWGRSSIRYREKKSVSSCWSLSAEVVQQDTASTLFYGSRSQLALKQIKPCGSVSISCPYRFAPQPLTSQCLLPATKGITTYLCYRQAAEPGWVSECFTVKGSCCCCCLS